MFFNLQFKIQALFVYFLIFFIQFCMYQKTHVSLDIDSLLESPRDTYELFSLLYTFYILPRSTSGTCKHTARRLWLLAFDNRVRNTSDRNRRRLSMCHCIDDRACRGCPIGDFSHKIRAIARNRRDLLMSVACDRDCRVSVGIDSCLWIKFINFSI